MTPDEARSFLGLGGIPIVVGLTELVKRTLPGMDCRFCPTVAMFWALLLNVGLAGVLAAPIPLAVLSGIITGLAAMRLYDAGPTTGTPPRGPGGNVV